MANYNLDYEGSEVQDILDTGKSLEDDGYIFLGTATPSTIPGTPTERVAYVGGPGTYNNFGTTVVVPSGSIVVITYSGSAWSKTVINASLPVSTTLENNDTTIPTGKAVKTAIDASVSAEATARGDADTALQNADTALQNAISAINTKLGEGYVYAGIATATTNPGTPTGKVFYVATAAGTYTNFGALVVTQGINILKYDGSAWSQEQLIGIDDVPTAGSDNLVKSGGVLAEFSLTLDEGIAYQCPTIGVVPTKVTAEGFYSLLIDVSLGNVLKVVGQGGNATRLWFTLDKDGKVVRNRAAGGNINSEPEYVTIQEGEVKFGYNTNINAEPLSKSFVGFASIPDTTEKTIQGVVSLLGNEYGKKTIVNLTQHGVYNRRAQFVSSEDWRTELVPCTYLDKITYVDGHSGNAGADGKPNVPAWITYDAYMNVIRYEETPAVTKSGNLTIGKKEAFFALNCISSLVGTITIEKQFVTGSIVDSITTYCRDLSTKKSFTISDFITGGVNTAGAYAFLSDTSNFRCLILKVKKGDSFIIPILSRNANVAAWCVFSKDKFILDKAVSTEAESVYNVTVTNDNAYYLAVNLDYNRYASKTFVVEYMGNLPLSGSDTPLNNKTLLLKEDAIRYDNWDNTKGYNCGDAQIRVAIVPVAPSDGFLSMVFKVTVGDTFLVYASGFLPTRMPTLITTDENRYVIRVLNITKTEEYFTIQEGEKWLFVNDRNDAYSDGRKAGYVYYWPAGFDGYGRMKDYEVNEPLIPDYDIDNAEITSVKHIYGVKTGDVTREYALRLYAEGLLRTGMPVTFANGLTTCVQTYDTNDSQRQVDVTLPISILDRIRNKTAKYVETYVGSLQNKTINLLTIGDSYLDANVNNLQGQNVGPWNFASWLKWFSMMDNEHIGNIKVNMVGTRNNKNRTIVYKGNTYTIRSCSEGVGGRSAYCYLNCPIAFKMGTAYEATVRLNSETAWYAFGLATQTPFDSTTAGRTFTEFSNTEENRMLLASTPFGRFKPDYGSNSSEYTKVAVLWNKLKEFPDFTGTGDYTGSAAQKELMTNWFDTKMDNPDNPFYSKAKARAYSGSHVWTNESAFDLSLYLSRYRTMNDNGVRLDEGDSNLGTLITSSTRTQYDVCTPTHIIIELGTNDVNAGLSVAKYGIDLLISEIQDWSASVKVIWCIARHPGVWWQRYQNLFANIVGLNSFTEKFDLNEYYSGLYDDDVFDKESQVHFCPTYNVQSVLGSPNCIQNIDLETEEPVIGNASDTVHCSIVAHKTIGYQLYSLLTALV